MTEYDDGLGDYFSDGDGGGAPAISWESVKPGTSWEGIIVPYDINKPDESYKTTQQRSIDGEYLFWSARPGEQPQPRKQGEITFLTEALADYELMSDRAAERHREQGKDDPGVRRQFIKGSKTIDGASAKEFRDALKAAGAGRPEVGAWVKQTLVKRVPLDAGKKANYVKWEYRKPTAETLAKVAAYIEAQKAEVAAAAVADDEPPF